ncbi:NUC091 domain-containing protein [Entophlyctis helioformis]|nr:NUC091 domain-containing protein [Entophlyctis helioformis]
MSRDQMRHSTNEQKKLPVRTFAHTSTPMGTAKKERNSAKAAPSTNSHSLSNVTKVKGVNFYRDVKKVRHLNMLKGGKPTRNSDGKIIKAAVFQSRLAPGTQARVLPDRRWFENTRVVGQKELGAFREALDAKLNDPYSFVLRTKQLPLGLVSEYQKQSRMHLLDTEKFGDTFGPKAQRKRPKMNASSMEDLVARADGLIDNYDVDKDEVLKVNEDGTIPEMRNPVFKKGQSKRIWGELYKVIDSSDIVMHVLDARDPIGTRCINVERHLKKEARHKQMIFVLNKCDLVPSWVAEKWKRTLEAEYPTVAFHANINNSFGKSALINLLRQFSKLHADKKQISVGLVGYPNTGKSSIINTLKSKKVCNVAPIPGETKVWQYITLMKRIYLIDCPGVVYGSSEDTETDIVLKGVVRVENIQQPEEHVTAILERCRPVYLSRTYGIKTWTDHLDFLSQLALKSGRLLKGGDADVSSVAKMVLNDWIRGKIPFYTLPKEKAGTPADGEAPAVNTVARVEQQIKNLRVIADFLPNEMELAGVTKEQLEAEKRAAEAAFGLGDDNEVDDEDHEEEDADDGEDDDTASVPASASNWRDDSDEDDEDEEEHVQESSASSSEAEASPPRTTAKRSSKRIKEPRMKTNKKKVGVHYYETANVKNRNRDRKTPKVAKDTKSQHGRKKQSGGSGSSKWTVE